MAEQEPVNNLAIRLPTICVTHPDGGPMHMNLSEYNEDKSKYKIFDPEKGAAGTMKPPVKGK